MTSSAGEASLPASRAKRAAAASTAGMAGMASTAGIYEPVSTRCHGAAHAPRHALGAHDSLDEFFPAGLDREAQRLHLERPPPRPAPSSGRSAIEQCPRRSGHAVAVAAAAAALPRWTEPSRRSRRAPDPPLIDALFFAPRVKGSCER